MQAAFRYWPVKPLSPPTSPREGHTYLSGLMDKPFDFAKLCGVKEFYSKICTW
jgi:hypothetical protein